MFLVKFLFAAALLTPLQASATELTPLHTQLLNESQSFQTTDAVKLGLNKDGLALRPKKALSGYNKAEGGGGSVEEYCNKGYYYDKTTKSCQLTNVCSPNNPCGGTTPNCDPAGDGVNYKCLCDSTSCGAGKACVGGECSNCQKGADCGCPNGQVSDGNGGCYTPNDTCNPNPCSGETPSCSALSETDYSCSCSSSSCPAGKKCGNMVCQNCSAGEDCGCNASGKEANGSGGCRCPGMKIASGNSCVCPSCYAADGTWGGCKKTCECVTCPDAKKCVEGECVNCPLGEDCGCFDDDAYSNGSGVCEPNDPCADVTCPSGQSCEEGTCVSSCPSNKVWSEEAGECCAVGSACHCPSFHVIDASGNCMPVENVECTTQEDCAVGEECLSNKCKACGSGQGSQCASFCKQGSNSNCGGSSSGGGSGSCTGCPTGCSKCNSDCKTCTECETGYYLESASCKKKGNCSPGSPPLHWLSISCTKCDQTTGKCQGSKLDTYGTLGEDKPCLDPNTSGIGRGCETGWCLPGGTAGRSGKYVQGSHCS